MFGPCFVIQYFMPFLFCNHLDGERRVGCFTLIAFLISCGCKCSVALPHCTMGWFAVRDCGVSYSYLLAFLDDIKHHMTFNIRNKASNLKS